MNMVSVIVPNHGRDISNLRASLSKGVDLVHIDRGLERSAQRNIGIRESKGDYLLFLDSDQSISPKLIDECLELFSFGYSAIYIPEVIIAKSLFGRIRMFEREFYTGTPVDVPRFVRRKFCPFFDEDLHGPEDSDWGNRIPGVKTISRNVLYHHDDISPIEYFRKKAYYTKSMKRYKEKWPNDPVLNPIYRCFIVFVENGKWKKMIRHPFLSLGMFIIIFIRGIIYCAKR